MKLESMDLFVAVVEMGSFTKAGEFCEVPKSTLSRQIKELEDELQVRLLDRTTRSLNLTPQGELFYKRAKDILHEVGSVKSEIASDQAGKAGRIVVYAPSIFIESFAIWFMQFRQIYPEIHLELMINDGIAKPDADRRYDLMIQSGILQDSSLVVRQLIMMEGGYYASPAYLKTAAPISSPQDLVDAQTVFCPFSDEDDPVWTFDNGKDKEYVRIKPNVITDSTQASISFCLAGAGIIRMACVNALPLVNAGLLCPILQDKYRFHFPLYALYPSRRYMPERVKLLLNYIMDVLPKSIEESLSVDFDSLVAATKVKSLYLNLFQNSGPT